MTSVLWKSQISLSRFVKVRDVLTCFGQPGKVCHKLIIGDFVWICFVTTDPRQISGTFVLACWRALSATLTLTM